MAVLAQHKSYISDISSEARQIIWTRADNVGEPYDYCLQASLRLMDDLVAEGYSAQMLRCKGLKNAALTADSRWIHLGPQNFWVHFIVKLDDDVVDLTRRQFFPLSTYPFIQSYTACEDEWDDVALVK